MKKIITPILNNIEDNLNLVCKCVEYFNNNFFKDLAPYEIAQDDNTSLINIFDKTFDFIPGEDFYGSYFQKLRDFELSNSNLGIIKFFENSVIDSELVSKARQEIEIYSNNLNTKLLLIRE